MRFAVLCVDILLSKHLTLPQITSRAYLRSCRGAACEPTAGNADGGAERTSAYFQSASASSLLHRSLPAFHHQLFFVLTHIICHVERRRLPESAPQGAPIGRHLNATSARLTRFSLLQCEHHLHIEVRIALDRPSGIADPRCRARSSRTSSLCWRRRTASSWTPSTTRRFPLWKSDTSTSLPSMTS